MVTILAWNAQCRDCGDVRDYCMVYDEVWEQAGLQPAEYWTAVRVWRCG
jgi:hypothetical protein